MLTSGETSLFQQNGSSVRDLGCDQVHRNCRFLAKEW